MKRSGFGEEQIIGILKEQEGGSATADVRRRHGVSSTTFYKRKANYGGMDLSDARRLRTLEDENCGSARRSCAPIDSHAIEAKARDERGGLPVAVRDPRAQPLAPRAAPVRARHGRRGPGLVDEHELPRVEFGLRLEPGPAPAHDVRAILLEGHGRSFFPRRGVGRSATAPSATWRRRAWPDGPAALQGSWSHASSNAAMTSACRASIRRDRMSPPCGFGAKLPVDRRCASQRITDDTDTPNRPAAARRLILASTAASARLLKSIASGSPIFLPRYLPREQRVRNGPLLWESPPRFTTKGSHSQRKGAALEAD
jgi:putative transposase